MNKDVALVENPMISNRIDTSDEDHTTRDSVWVANIWDGISNVVGLEMDHRTEVDAPVVGIVNIFSRFTGNSNTSYKTNVFWKLLIDNRDYSLIRWFKVTGFIYKAGGSVQSEDLDGREFDEFDLKFIHYSNRAFNYFILFKNIIFLFLGFLGFGAFIFVFIYSVDLFIKKLLTKHVPISEIVVCLGIGLVYLVATAIQVFSIYWTLGVVLRELRCDSSDIRKHLNLTIFNGRDHDASKRDAFEFFYATMTVLILLLSWPALLSKTTRFFVAQDLSSPKWGFLICLCYFYFFMLNVTQYLSICMFFISVSLKQVRKNQYELLSELDGCSPKDRYNVKIHDDIITYVWNKWLKKLLSLWDYFCYCCDCSYNTERLMKLKVSIFDKEPFIDESNLDGDSGSCVKKTNGFIEGTKKCLKKKCCLL